MPEEINRTGYSHAEEISDTETPSVGKMSPTELRSYINEKASKLAENHSTDSVEELMSNPTFLEYKAALDRIMNLENYYPGIHGISTVDKKKKAKARKKGKIARKQRKFNRKNGKINT